jgi:hypothetical protein
LKHTAPQLSKFKRLMRRLNLGKCHTMGMLEAMWHATISSARNGAIGIAMSDEDIAIELEWPGDPGELIDALIECKWLDSDPAHRLLVHDWPDHCPNFIKAEFKKYGKQFAFPSTVPSTIPRSVPSTVPSTVPRHRATIRNHTIPNNNTPLTPQRGAVLGTAEPETELPFHAPIAPEPWPEPAKPKKQPKPVAFPVELASPDFEAAWTRWEQHRREKRSALTDSTRALQLKACAAMGERRAIAAIDHSIAMGWTGLFEDKAKIRKGEPLGIAAPAPTAERESGASDRRIPAACPCGWSGALADAIDIDEDDFGCPRCRSPVSGDFSKAFL